MSKPSHGMPGSEFPEKLKMSFVLIKSTSLAASRLALNCNNIDAKKVENDLNVASK